MAILIGQGHGDDHGDTDKAADSTSTRGGSMRANGYLCYPALLAGFAMASPSLAQSGTAPAAGIILEEVVVTAERREADVQKSALTINVIGADELERGGVTNVKDLINSVPGLSVTTAAPSANLSLMGIAGGGASPAYTDPTVSFNLGGVSIARQFSTTAAFYDLERVEVLKGPQGTLYGRNATVGAVNVIPAQPTFTYAGAAGLEFGNYNELNTTMMANLPFNDTVALRIAAHTNKHDGYLSNGYNDANNQAARASLLIKPNDDVSLLLSGDYFRDNSKGVNVVYLYPNGANGGKWLNNNDPWTGLQPTGCGNPTLCPTYSDGVTPVIAPLGAQSVVGNDGFQNNRQLVWHAELNWNLGPLTLTVLPAVVNTDTDYKNYSSGFYQLLTDHARQHSLETRLASNNATRFKWLVGLYGFRETQDAFNRTLQAGGVQYTVSPNLIDKSYAVFGDVTWSLLDTLRLNAGLRYTHESKSQDGYVLNPPATASAPAFTTATCVTPGGTLYGASADQPNGACAIPSTGETSFNDTSFKIGIEYDVAAQSMAYAIMKTGFKAGGLWIGTPPNSYKPEKLTDYELGIKNRFFNNRLQANAAVFYWDYKDQQITAVTPINPFGQTGRPFNVPGWLDGIELSIDWLISESDRVTADSIWQRGQYKQYPANSSNGAFNSSHNDWPRVNLPPWTASFNYDHTFNLGSSKLIAGVSSHFESGTWLNVDHIDGTYRDRFNLWNADLTYVTSDERWRITAFMENIENEAVVYTGTNGQISRGILFRPTANANASTAALGAPRTYGLRINAKF